MKRILFIFFLLAAIKVSSQPLASGLHIANNIEELRNFYPLNNNATITILVVGKVTPGDGLGDLYYWSRTSSATDDTFNVVKPTATTGNGRWLRMNNYLKSGANGFHIGQSDVRNGVLTLLTLDSTQEAPTISANQFGDITIQSNEGFFYADALQHNFRDESNNLLAQIETSGRLRTYYGLLLNAGVSTSTGAALKFNLDGAQLLTIPERGAFEPYSNSTYYTDSTATRFRSVYTDTNRAIDGALPIGRTATGHYKMATLTEGSDINVTNGDGNITIAVEDTLQKSLENPIILKGLKTSGSTPSFTAGVGAGSSPTVSITGNDLAGYISLTTGTSPTGGSDVLTVTFSETLSTTPKCITLTAASSNAGAKATAVYIDQPSTSTTQFKIKSNGNNLVAGTLYVWYYQVIQ